MNISHEPLYCPVAYQNFSAGSDFQLIHLLLQNRNLLLPFESFQVLDACKSLRTIAEHSNMISKKVKPCAVEDIKQHIDYLIDMNLLIPCAKAFPLTQKKSKTKISALAIVTADREQDCLRAFTSYSNYLSRYSRDAAITVVDDSRKLNSLRESLINLSDTAEREIRYAGYAEKEIFASALSRAGIEPEVARFAIIGRIHPNICSIGANRNALLLDTVGENIFSVDDDTVCALRPHPLRVQKLRFECTRNPRDTWFYRERRELIEEPGWGYYDLLGEHEELLGESAARLAQSKDEDHLEGNNVCGDLLYALQSGYGTVLATMSGIAGDSGGYSSKWVLSMGRSNQQRLKLEDEQLRIALDSREILGIVPAPTVTPSSFCIATTIGLANEHLLPPFLPIGRNEDGVFGGLFNMAGHYALLGHVPLAVLHDAQKGRAYMQYPKFRLADLTLSLMEHFDLGGNIPISALLRRLGQNFIESSSLPDIELRDLISECVLVREARKIRRMSIIAKDAQEEGLRHFQEEALLYRKYVIQNVTSGPAIIPVEMCDAFGRNAFVKMREFLFLVGRLFYQWQDIVDAARHLRKADQRMSILIGSQSNWAK
jgi:hypothetical protein